VAVRDITAGEVVLTETALVSGPGSKTPPVCVECLADWSGENVCCECGWPVCGEKCAMGERHQVECTVLARCPVQDRPDFVHSKQLGNCPEFALIFPLRLALLGQNSDRDRLSLLMDHKEDLERHPNYENKWNKPVIEYLTKTFDSGVNKDDLLRGIGIFCTNAAYMGHRNGRWLLPTFSFLSHSCVCNSRFFISPAGKVVVRAQTSIKSGEEITISYFPTHRGNVIRRQTMQDLWFFTCTCLRCQDKTELGTFLSSVKCRRCKDEKEGFLLPEDVSNLKSRWECGKCGISISHSTMIKLVHTLSAEVKNKDMELHDVEKLIERFQNILHPQHFLIMELKQKWVEMAATKELNGNIVILNQIISYIYDIFKVNSCIDPGLTITLGQNLKHLNRAMLSLAKMKMAAGEISKQEFMRVAAKAATNIKIATDCFENTDFTVKCSLI